MTGTLSRRTVIGAAAVSVAMPFIRAQAQTRDLKLGIITPENHTWNQILVQAAAELKERSGGRLSLTVFPAAQLGPEAAMIQQLQTGALDMAWITVTEISNRIPDYAALLAPFLVKDVGQASRLLKTKEAAVLLDRLPEIGAVGLGYGMTGMRQMYARTIIDGADALRGKKMRIIPAAPFRDFYNLVGAAPTPIPFPQVYDALANGQIDAIDMDFEGTVVYRLHEHLTMLLMTNHFMFPNVSLVSSRLWGGLPESDRSLIADVMRKNLDLVHQRIVSLESEFLDKLKKTKLAIKPVDASFFGDIVTKWDETWMSKAPALKGMRALAKTV